MKKKYGKYILLGLSCALVMAVVAFFLVARKNNNQKPAGEFYTVKKGDITNFTEQTGILKAQVGAIVKVGTRATGTLMFMKYQIGDSVKKGELIAQIDDREIVANIRNAEAQVLEQKRDIEVKEATLLYNKINYDRELRLLEKEFTTKDGVDKAKRELDVAVASLELTRARLRQAEERLRQLQITLSYTKIYAPISGYVSAVTTQQGETVVSGLAATSLVTVIDPTKLEMWIYVDETDVGRVKPGQKVLYWVDAYRDKRFFGTISLIYPQPEIKDNVVYYLAIVKINPKDAGVLRPEMTTHARIVIEEKKDVLVVPNNAVRFEGGKNVVYLKAGSKEELREVKPGIRDDRYTEILAGLSEGETIVIPVLKKPVQTQAPRK
jgi:RND family efflux transporter MFP subunit